MKKLTKSNDKVLTGVLGGFAEYFGADKALVRIIGAALMDGNWILPRSIPLYYCSSNNARKNRQR